MNSIIQQRACLPSQSGKVEEGALVNLTDYSMKLLEKKVRHRRPQGFLPFHGSVPVHHRPAGKEKAAGHSGSRRAGRAGKLRRSAPRRGSSRDADRQSGRRQRQSGIHPAGASKRTPPPLYEKERGGHPTPNGIEVKIPTELLNSDNEVEFLHSDDGSISLLIKKCDPVRNDLKLSPRTDRAPTISAESLFSYLQKPKNLRIFRLFFFHRKEP